MEATGGQASDLTEAEILATTVHAMVKAGPSEDPTLSTNTIEVIQKSAAVMEVFCYHLKTLGHLIGPLYLLSCSLSSKALVESLSSIEAPDPSAFDKTYEEIMGAASEILKSASETGSLSSDYNAEEFAELEEEDYGEDGPGIVSQKGLCAGLSAGNIVAAEGSHMEYEALTSDDRKN